MKTKIYIVESRNKKLEDWTSKSVSQECYKTKEQAIEFCMEKMNKEELEEYKTKLARGLISWYEFDTRNYVYTITELILK